MKADEIYGTKNPTAHRVLLDARFELPFGEIQCYLMSFPILSLICHPYAIPSPFDFMYLLWVNCKINM